MLTRSPTHEEKKESLKMEEIKFNCLRLKAERIARGLTIQDMAEALGYKYDNQYQHREAGRTPIRVDEFAKIMNIFNLDMGESAIFFDSSYQKRTNKRVKQQ